MEELKRCPFCGSKAQLTRHANGKATIGCTGVLDKECCGYPNTFESVPIAIKAWNKRFDIKCSHPDCNCAVKCND